MASKDLRQLIDQFEREFTGRFDPVQLEIWLSRLRGALANEYSSDRQIWDKADRFLRSSFRNIAKHAKKRHRIPLYALGPETIEARFQNLLADRIRASAELIKLNRDEEIEKQLRRFAGWATGALPDQKKRPAMLKKGLNKSLRGMTYEKRRVCIDQGHKLMAAVDDVIAQEYGAIAKRWRHIIPHADYQSRPEHLARDKKVYAVKGNPELKAKRMKKGPNPYVEDLPDQPKGPPFCSCWWESIYDLDDLPADMRA